MRMHQEFIEEVYNNTSFRSEFMSYAKLRLTLNAAQQSKPKAPAAPNPKGINFISYNDLTTAETKVEDDLLLVMKCKRGLSFLYSSLSRALSRIYQLDAEETRRLIFAVAERHAQSLNL